MVYVYGSASTSTGFAPRWVMTFAVAIMVNVGMMTSSPGPTPATYRASCSAVVPFVHEMPYLAPTALANASSNWIIFRPVDDIQCVSTHSVKYLSSFPWSVGSQTGIIFPVFSTTGMRLRLILISGSLSGITLRSFSSGT